MRNARIHSFVLLVVISSCPLFGQAWTLTLEEPTGIYRRDREIVTVSLAFGPGEARPGQLRLLDPQARPVPYQFVLGATHADGSIQSATLLFPTTLIPGQRPEYRLLALQTSPAPSPESLITARRIGVGRLEMANDRFGVLLNLGLENTEPAITSAFNKTADEPRMLNLIDTSPDVEEPLPHGRKNAGVGTFMAVGKDLPRAGAFSEVEILEAGPFRGRVRLNGARLGGHREVWEFTWLAGSPVLHWRAHLEQPEPGSRYGFFFSCLSAHPYVPFTRWMDGEETRFPDGWETDNPPDQRIAPKDFQDLPGRHVVYYQREENYGAFGLYELDHALAWQGIGSRQVVAARPLAANDRSIQIALAFPRWKGTETVLEARQEYRKWIQPILSVATPAAESAAQPREPEGTAPAAASAAISERVPEYSLDGPWKLEWAEKSEGEKKGFPRIDFDDAAWQTVQVPGTVHTQILPEPKYFTPEADWISSKEWWYRRRFQVPQAMRNRPLRVRFEATDYYADVYLNGRLLGRHEGYIDPYEFDLGGKIRADGENLLAVRVWTPVHYYWRHRPYTIKGSYGGVDQKPDNITAVGITRSVRLLGGGPLFIRDLAIDTRLNRDGSADVVVDLELESTRNEVESEIRLVLAPRNFQSDSNPVLVVRPAVGRGLSKHRCVIRVDKPQLWWTWDHGKPNLYTLEVTSAVNGRLSDRRSLAVGIREIEQIDWKFYLNGKRLFIRGTNSYYHLFLSERRRADYERDLGMMQRMNINMIRLHCHFSNPEFYDLADELGLLIWQDYLEAWYPEDRDFALRAADLYDPLIRAVRNHPSVALWATSDEESLENYRVLTKHLEPRPYACDPQRRPVVRSTGRYGDGHIYYGWYGGSIWQYTRMTEKFVSELGATALPDYESLIRFLPDAWPIRGNETRWIFHKLQIGEAMRAWGDPGGMSLRDYIPQTQAYVARLFQLAIERMRRLKYDPAGGILHFHAIDIWPSVTMAAIDFYRRPTKAYTTVQRSFQMILPSIAYDRDTWKSGETVQAELWLINDHWTAVPDTAVGWAVEREGGGVIESGSHPGRETLAADSSRRLTEMRFRAGEPGRYQLRAWIKDPQGKTLAENLYEFQVKSP